MWNTQALGVSSQGLPNTPPFLSCPSADGPSTPNTSSSQTIVKQKHRSDVPDSRRLIQPPQARDGDLTDTYPMSAEILEAACNESIPGLTGVSNFTVFLYCKLFEGENSSLSVEADMGLDLHATCSDAAWYLSAAEDDFLWVHVCSEFFAQEFNNTVCANSSFWLQRAHQVRTHPALTLNACFELTVASMFTGCRDQQQPSAQPDQPGRAVCAPVT